MTCLSKNSCAVIVVCIAATFGAAQTVAGADLGSGPPPLGENQLSSARPWILSFTPYSWLSGLNGETTAKGRTTDIDVSPIKVLEHLDGMPWMSYAEARKGRLALYNDIVYAPLAVDAGVARSFDRITLNAALGVDVELTIIEVGAAYEIARWSSGGSIKDSYGFARYTAIDLLAGARYWHQQVAINLALTTTIDTTALDVSRDRAIARSGNIDWVDPLVGLRIRHQLLPGHELMLRADVGGFDVGSKFSWNVLGAYSWLIAARHGVTYSGVLGYRALSVDFEKGSGINRYEYDAVQHGPILGLTAKF